MKTARILLSILSVLVCSFSLSACGDLLWQAAQLPGLRGISDRMNERAIKRRFGSDPMQELAQNTQQGDYRFRGLMDTGNKRSWAPGIPDGSYPSAQIEYLVTDHTQTWTPSAVRYFSTYNRALVSLRQGKKLDSYGMRVQ